MITNQPNPQQTRGFPLPSEGTYFVPNQYSNAHRNLVFITNNLEERRFKNKGKAIPLGNINLQESGKSKGILLNLEPQLWPRVLCLERLSTQLIPKR